MNYAKGQLIFTSHNLSTMQQLKGHKNAIDIIDLNGNIVTWKQSGNANPDSAYRRGLMTEDSFRYDEFDFYEVFCYEEK